MIPVAVAGRLAIGVGSGFGTGRNLFAEVLGIAFCFATEEPEAFAEEEAPDALTEDPRGGRAPEPRGKTLQSRPATTYSFLTGKPLPPVAGGGVLARSRLAATTVRANRPRGTKL